MKNMYEKMLYVFVLITLFFSCSKESDKIVNDIEGKDTFIGYNYTGIDDRPFLKCGQYSDDDINKMNQALAKAIAQAPNKREKVVVAANFQVTMDHVVPYAYEPGGEAYKLVCRYSRKGLFLKNIEENGYLYPAWGCDVIKPVDFKQDVKNLGKTYANGLHCSSFVGWCLVNGEASKAELVDKTWANDYRVFPGSKEVPLKTGRYDIKPGDLMWFNGHVAIVIGVKGDVVTFAESALWGGNHTDQRNGTRWRTFNRETENYDTFRFKSLIKMDGVYNK